MTLSFLYVWLMILKSIISPSNRVDLWIFMVDIFIATWDNINQQPVGLQLLPKSRKRSAQRHCVHGTGQKWKTYHGKIVERHIYTIGLNWSTWSISFFSILGFVRWGHRIIYEPDQRVQLSIARMAEEESHDTYYEIPLWACGSFIHTHSI